MTKEEFRKSINHDTAVTFQFCKKLYGYGYYDQEYIQSILDKFDEMGRPFAKYIFGLYLKTELKLEAEMYKEAGQDMLKEIDRKYERMVKESQWNMKNMTMPQLKELCKKLLQEGAINSPEEFVMMAGLDR